MEISLYPVILRLIQKFFTKRVHRNFHVSCNIETNSKMFLPTYKWSMEISTYTVTLLMRLYQKFFTERVHGNSMYPVTLRLILFKNVLPKGSMEISMYPVILRLIQKFFTKRAHGNFHVPSNIETNSKLFLLKGSMEISMYPVILRLTRKFFTYVQDRSC